MGKSVPKRVFVHPRKHIFGWNFLTKPVPYLFSGPNWQYDAFGGKIVLDENFAQFCLKSPFEFVFPKNTFSVWIFVLNHTSPILWAKRTRWHYCGQKCPAAKFRPSQKTRFRSEFVDETPYLFSGPNWLYGAFGGKIVPDESFAQFCLKSPLKFVFPKNTFLIWILVLNRTLPIFLARRTRWRDCGQKCPWAKFRPS